MALSRRASKRRTSSATAALASRKRRQIKTPRVEKRARYALSPTRVASARRKFLRAFPAGFRDETYVDWERTYKWAAHLEWQKQLDVTMYRRLLRDERYAEIAARAVRIESRTNLLFSFEKMALRDAVRQQHGAKLFARALFELLHGRGELSHRFEDWIAAIAQLPRRQTRVLTWPLSTVFGFLAQPELHFFFKPTVTRAAAARLGVELPYAARPSWLQYKTLLEFVHAVRRDIRGLKPRDMIDLQSFLWVQGSDEYPG